MMATVLIVDDEESIQRLLQMILQRAGHKTLLASDGAQGLDMVGRSRPDLVILDDMLPDISGSEICRRVKGDPFTRDIPVMMYSAGCRIHNPGHLQAIGADAALDKALGTRELLKTIDHLLLAYH